MGSRVPGGRHPSPGAWQAVPAQVLARGVDAPWDAGETRGSSTEGTWCCPAAHGMRNTAPGRDVVMAWLSLVGAAPLEEARLRRAPGRCAEPPPTAPRQSPVVPVGRHTLPLSYSLLFFNTKSRNYFLNDCNFIF